MVTFWTFAGESGTTLSTLYLSCLVVSCFLRGKMHYLIITLQMYQRENICQNIYLTIGPGKIRHLNCISLGDIWLLKAELTDKK